MMKKHLLAISAIALCSNAANAQSSVSIYGIIDAGINYFSSAKDTNGNKHSIVRMDTGVSQGSRIGFKGTEDLGGGNAVFFTLENGFNVDTGTQGQGALFGRQAFVGLKNADIGSVSFGRQYDFMGNFAGYATGGRTVAGSLGWGLHMNAAAAAATGGPLDDRVSGSRVDNAIKYESPVWSGFSLGAMYGLGEQAGSVADGSTFSAIANYKNGPFSTSLAYTDIKKNSSSATSTAKRVYGFGVSYAMGDFAPFFSVTQAKNPDETSTAIVKRVTTFDLGTTYNISSALVLGGGFQYQKRDNDIGSASQLNASLDYFLSKRTDIYVAAAYGKDKGSDAGYTAAVMSGGGLNAYGNDQTALRVGLRHKF